MKSYVPLLPQKLIQDLINNALLEDNAWQDLTSLGLYNYDKIVNAKIMAKQDMILAGMDVAAQCFKSLSLNQVVWKPLTGDGKSVQQGQDIARIEANAWIVLAAERTALNFLQRLSGIATLTKSYVDKIAGFKAKIVDTRKTTPCYRILEKYAVRCGGGLNHRFGLNDGCLIKDNHIRLAGGIREAVESIRATIPFLIKIEVEVETIDQVEECLGIGIDAILLDNMQISDIKRSVEIVNGMILVEASGGINLDNVAEIASAGVDYISIGALTHSAQSVDISLELE